MADSNETLLGRVAVASRLITMDQLNEAVREYGKAPGSGALGDKLVEMGFLTRAQLDQVLKLQQQVIAKANRKSREIDRPAGPPPQPAAAKRVEAARPAPAKEGVERVQPSEPVRGPEPAGSTDGLEDAAPRTMRDLAKKLASKLTRKPVEAEPAPGTAPSAALTRTTPPEPIRAAPPAQAPAAQAPAAAPAAPERQRAPERPPGDTRGLDALLREAVDAGASDIHVHSGAPLRFRMRGKMYDHGSELLDTSEAEALLLPAPSDLDWQRFHELGEQDFCYELEGVGRFRANVYRQLRGTDGAFRFVPPEPPTLAQLGLPSTLARFTTYHQGMVLLTGPTSCGKSSTMAALVNLINEERTEHILTIEDPIEYLHRSKRCLVNQRSVRRHTKSFARALRGALREDPDVIVIGELRDRETIGLALSAAETGHFVLATLHTDNAVGTVNRLIGAFPPEQQDQVRSMLSESLKAVISQRLLATADEQGMVTALEVMIVNRPVGNLIREQKTVQIRSLLQTGSSQGMSLLDNSLAELVSSKKISRDDALKACEDPKYIPG